MKKYMKCQLCDTNEANQTGAHIFPAWMIASCFDVENRTRDHEIIYALHPFDSLLPFIGNSVKTSKIEEQIGRQLTEEEIINQRNYLTVDNLWCRQCERKFTLVEEYFLQNIDRQYNDFSNCNNTSVLLLNNANTYIIRLFFYSLFFRAHLANFMGFKLHWKAFLKIKYFLNHYIKDNLQNTIEFISASYRKDQITKYPLRSYKIEHQDPSDGWVFAHSKHYKPYCFIINSYIIQFYCKGDRAKFRPESFFGVSKVVRENQDIKNYKEVVFKLGLMNKTLYTSIKRNYINYVTQIRMNNFITMFKLLFKYKFKHYPTRQMTSIFLKELCENDLPLGIKYTKERIVAAMNRTMEKINALPPTRTIKVS